jgi:hypothetical protein
MKSVSWKGVLIGGVFDIVVSSLLSGAVFIGFFFAFRNGLSGSVADQIKELLADRTVVLTSMLVGGAVSIAAGYISASIARRAELLNGALSSFLCVAEGLYSLVGHAGMAVTPQSVLLILLSPALGLVGGYLRRRHRPQVS